MTWHVCNTNIHNLTAKRALGIHNNKNLHQIKLNSKVRDSPINKSAYRYGTRLPLITVPQSKGVGRLTWATIPNFSNFSTASSTSKLQLSLNSSLISSSHHRSRSYYYRLKLACYAFRMPLKVPLKIIRELIKTLVEKNSKGSRPVW